MRIGIDARLYGLEHAGIGRYVEQLIHGVLKFDHRTTFVLFIRPEHKNDFTKYQNVELVVTQIPIYSFSEQLLFPLVLLSAKLDLLHVPHFNAPFLYPKPFILTVHDLIKDDSVGSKTTTRSAWFYHIKRLGYLFLRQVVTARAQHIIVPTKQVKQVLIDRLKLSESKISVTYEAVSSHIKHLELPEAEQKEVLHKYHLTQPFIVYTGSVYPHKNVDFLVNAIIKYNSLKEMDLKLAVICARSVFFDRLQSLIVDAGAQSQIKLLGYLPDSEVSRIYSLALALVHPSKMEGFGLTGLEAMSAGLPVLAADASCLPEVYGQAALYFDPNNIDDLVLKLSEIIKSQPLREQLVTAGYQQSKLYSWDKLAKQTLKIYRT